jgi:hypothetical protein
VSGQQEQYLADVNRLVQYAKGLPHVRHEFVVEVASMSREDLQRRVLCGSDWIGHFHKCLDGIKEIRCIGGAAIDGCRDPRAIRAIVDRLVANCPVTWERTYLGEPKGECVEQPATTTTKGGV